MFTIDHGLRCKKGGGLVGIQHEDTHNKASAPAALALPNGKVAYKLMINYGRNITETQPTAPRQTKNAAVGRPNITVSPVSKIPTDIEIRTDRKVLQHPSNTK